MHMNARAIGRGCMENTPHVAGDQQASIQHGEPRADNAEQPAADSTIRVPPFALTDEQEKAVRASLVQTRPNVRAEMAAHIAPFITLQKWTEQPYPAPAPSADPQEPKPHESADLDSLQE